MGAGQESSHVLFH